MSKLERIKKSQAYPFVVDVISGLGGMGLGVWWLLSFIETFPEVAEYYVIKYEETPSWLTGITPTFVFLFGIFVGWIMIYRAFLRLPPRRKQDD